MSSKTGQVQYHNVFHYSNQPSDDVLRELSLSLKYDTLMLRKDNPNGPVISEDYFSMRALPRPSNDNSVDWMPQATRSDGKQGIVIFRGGPGFGSKRFYVDSADFFIQNPKHLDSDFESASIGGLVDCGDMTGSGNRVLGVGCGFGGAFRQAMLFYVLGSAIDDRIDMYYWQEPYPGFTIDTLTANEDNFQDLLIGTPGLHSWDDADKGKTSVGSLQVLYGTDRIPVHVNAVHAFNYPPQAITVMPNPFVRETMVTLPESIRGLTKVSVHNVLGMIVHQEQHLLDSGQDSILLTLPILPLGSYILTVSDSESSASTKIFITSSGGRN